MARISTYTIDGALASSDKLIGTDSSGTITKNYPLGSVSDWLKESGASAVLGQNNYNFQIVPDPDTGRLSGTISFEDYGGDGVEFADISTLVLSNSSSTGKYVGDYLLSTVGDKVILGQLDDLNNFGVYTLVSLVQSPSETGFYNAELLFVEGNGALLGNGLYGLATHSASESAVWGNIEGTVTNQTDLVDYIDAEIAAIPVPATPTLQSVTDAGNTTTNNIGIGATTGLFYPLTIEPNGTSNYIELRGSSNAGLYAVGKGLLAFDTSKNFIVYAGGINERMRVTSAGRVGIGTTAPSEILQVGNDSVGSNYIQIAKKDNSHAGIKISETSGGRIGFLRVNQSEDLEIGTELNNDVDIFTNGVSRVTIEGDNGPTQGYVGIGTATPESKLTVNGYIQVPNGRGITFSDIGDGNANRVSIVGSEDSDTMFFKTDNSVRMAFASGNVGIGTTAPSTLLHLRGDSPTLRIEADGANESSIIELVQDGGVTGGSIKYNGASNIEALQFNTGVSDTRMTIKRASGNVGIGTTAPAYKLQVGGTINADKIFINNTTDGHQIGKLIIDYQAAQNPALNSAGGDYIRFNNSILLGGNGDNIKASSTKSDDLYFQHQRTGNVGFRFTTADSGSVLRIAGSGNVGIGTTAPDSKVHISGTAMQQLRMETAGGPSSAGDTNGRIGDMAYDDDFFYIKTANGWGRVQLDFGF